MAFVFRLIAVFLLALVSSAAFAFAPSQTEYRGTSYLTTTWFPSATAYCSAAESYLNDASVNSYSTSKCEGGSHWLDRTTSTGTFVAAYVKVYYTTRAVCPPHSLLVNGSCVCDSGYQENGGLCTPIPPVCSPPNLLVGGICTPPPPDCVSPQVLIDGTCQAPPPPECNIPLGSPTNTSSAQFTRPGYGGGMACFQQCISYPSFSGRSPEGQYFAHGPWTSTGVVCSGSGNGSSPPPPSDPADPGSPPDPSSPPDPDPPPVQPPPDQCKVGQCPGSVNGTFVCVPCSNTTSNNTTNNNTTNNTTNPDGSPADPTSPSNGTSPNGTTNSTKNETTKCVDGKCTTATTTTTTNPDGTTTVKTDKKEESKDDFCTQKPKSPLCLEGTFGGACAGGWSCTGDAVQCATAKAVNDQACALKVDPANSVLGVGNSALGGGNGTGHPLDSITDVDVGTLNQTNPWGAGCPADKHLATFMGEAITLPLSSACGVFQTMGNLLVGFALLAGAFIVVGKK